MESHDFRRRCEAALAHPVTLVALALLLVNDIVLKALFPGAWAVGKLSDLAWVVFAPPLLAFALSFAVPKRSAAGRRTALIIAYGGLPLLYAAFNTFAPVHDAIMQVLLIGAESGALGSPMDASDSLVIPFGLALAIWAWRRSAASAGGGGGTRARFGLLVAGIAAFASVATSYPERVDGVASIGVADDGTVLATADYGGGFISDDGGMSWSLDEEAVSYEEFVWSSQSVKTPRGEYSATGSGVERVVGGGERELVYSTGYLRGDANEWMQEQDTQNFAYRLLATRPGAIIYHAESGNLIAAMGIQGVAVETPDGRWHRVAVGSFSPTDFSFFAKMRALLESGWTVGAVAIALSLSMLTVAASASTYENRGCGINENNDISFVGFTALGCLLAFGLLALGMLGPDAIGAYFIVAPAVVLTTWIATFIAAVKSKGAGQWRLAAFACALTLTLAAATLFSFGISGNSPDIIVISVELVALTAFIALVPPLAYHARLAARHWRAFALAFLGMNALIALALVAWLTLNISLPAAQAAIAILVGLAAVVLVRHVRDARREDAVWDRIKRR